jgi:hypothetical protein
LNTTPLTPIDTNPSLSSLVGNVAAHITIPNVESEDTQWGVRFFSQQTTSTPTVISTNPTSTPTSTPTPPSSPTSVTNATPTAPSFQYINRESELEQVDIEGELSM